MARSVKRKAPDSDDEIEEDDEDILIQQHVARRRLQSKISSKRRRTTEESEHTPSIPAENHLMKLPGELRNEIFELALGLELDDDNDDLSEPQEDTAVTMFIRARQLRWLPDSARIRWREPSLLQVSKQVRQEASPFYYLSNRFRLFVRSGEVENACAWLGQISRRCAGLDRMDFSLRLLSPKREEIASWISLARLAYVTDLGYDTEQADVEAWVRRVVRKRGRFSLAGEAIEEVVTLGVVARQRSRSSFRFNTTLRGWATAKLRGTSKFRVKHKAEVLDSLEEVLGGGLDVNVRR